MRKCCHKRFKGVADPARALVSHRSLPDEMTVAVGGPGAPHHRAGRGKVWPTHVPEPTVPEPESAGPGAGTGADRVTHPGPLLRFQPASVLSRFSGRFGKEVEVAAHTHLDSHRVEKPRNHWMLVTGNPRRDSSTMLDVPKPPAEDARAPEQDARAPGQGADPGGQ